MGRKKKLTCDGCDAKCCRYVCVEVDTPKKLREFEEFVYYLHHDGIRMVACKDAEGLRWYLEFGAVCRYIDANGRCRIYENRPRTCREHKITECEHYNAETFTNIDTVEQLIDYVRDTLGKKKLARKLSDRLPPELRPVAAK